MSDKLDSQSDCSSIDLDSNGAPKSGFYRFVRLINNFVLSLFPIFRLPSRYSLKKYFLFGDLPAGVYIGLYHIPQCLGYGILATYPMVYSLHTCVVASIIYLVLGSHRRLSYGVYSLVSALYINIILNRTRDKFGNTPIDSMQVVSLSTFLVGIYSLGAAFLRLGSLIRFVPYEILSAFRAGLYLLVFALQLDSIFGTKLVGYVYNKDEPLLMPRLYNSKFKLSNINWATVTISLCCFTLIAIFRLIYHYWSKLFSARLNIINQIIRRIPVEFLLVVVGFTVVTHADTSKYNFTLIGSIEHDNKNLIDVKSIHFTLPNFKTYFTSVWYECCVATILCLMYTHSLAVDFNTLDTELKPKRKFKKQINPKQVKYIQLGWKQYCPNHELFTQSVINCAGSMMNCLPCGPSSFRSHRLRDIGGKTQVAGVISCLTIYGLWYVLHNYLYNTPICIVSSIVAFEALLSFLKEVAKLKHFWTVSILDLLIWILTLSAFIILNIELSLYISVFLSLIVFLFRSKLFKPKKFKPQKPLSTSQDSSLMIPESILQQAFFQIDHNDFNSLYLPISQLKLNDIYIFRVDDRYLSVSMLDHFIREVFRKISFVMKTDCKTRIVFDCSKLAYIDWISIRLIKAIVMRTIELSNSWILSFNTIVDHNENKCDQSISNDEVSMLQVVFVFRTRQVQLIHNAGSFDMPFYHTLHKCLHIGLKGAINSMITSDDWDYQPRNSVFSIQSNASIKPKIKKKLSPKQDIPQLKIRKQQKFSISSRHQSFENKIKPLKYKSKSQQLDVDEFHHSNNSKSEFPVERQYDSLSNIKMETFSPKPTLNLSLRSLNRIPANNNLYTKKLSPPPPLPLNLVHKVPYPAPKVSLPSSSPPSPKITLSSSSLPNVSLPPSSAPPKVSLPLFPPPPKVPLSSSSPPPNVSLPPFSPSKVSFSSSSPPPNVSLPPSFPSIVSHPPFSPIPPPPPPPPQTTIDTIKPNKSFLARYSIDIPKPEPNQQTMTFQEELEQRLQQQKVYTDI